MMMGGRMLLYVLLTLLWSGGVSGKRLQGKHRREHRNLIVGGHDAERGRYPYFASFDHWGSGVLIGK